MPAMIDAQCPKCRRRFGWHGDLTDRPACPRCGHQLPAAELAADQRRFEADLHALITHPRDATPALRKRQRELAGLTLKQAARQIGCTPRTLEDCEAGSGMPSPGMLADMARVYGCGGPKDPDPNPSKES